MSEPILNIHQELVSRCLAGDQDAHFRLYQLYSRAMYNVSYRITGDEDEAEDALQEAFISAFRNLDHYRGEASFGSWLKRIVVNKAINHVKRRRMEVLPDNEEFDVAEEEPESQYQTDWSVDKVREAIDRLPDGYRAVLSLYLIEGYDHQEIAQIMSITESTSKSQLNRAKNKLREILTSKS